MYMSDGTDGCQPRKTNKKKELLDRLNYIALKEKLYPYDCDFLDEHEKAEKLIIEYIDDSEVKAAYDGIRKWYT